MLDLDSLDPQGVLGGAFAELSATANYFVFANPFTSRNASSSVTRLVPKTVEADSRAGFAVGRLSVDDPATHRIQSARDRPL